MRLGVWWLESAMRGGIEQGRTCTQAWGSDDAATVPVLLYGYCSRIAQPRYSPWPCCGFVLLAAGLDVSLPSPSPRFGWQQGGGSEEGEVGVRSLCAENQYPITHYQISLYSSY